MSVSFIGQSGLPLGLRNNNPGDLRTGISWLGAIGSENGFITFKSIDWGLRALAYDLSNKYFKDGLTTISEIITKYAPPTENDTQAYIDAVSYSMGITPDSNLNLNSDILQSLIRAVITHELGASYSSMITDADIQDGIQLVPQNILDTLGNFFAADPALASVATVGIVAVILVLVSSLYKYGKINFSTIKNTLHNAFRNF